MKQQMHSRTLLLSLLLFILNWRSCNSSAESSSTEFDFEYGKTLLFTVRANSNKNAYSEFVSGRNDPAPDGYEMPTVFRSSLIDKLASDAFFMEEAKIVVEMTKNDDVVSQVVFDISEGRSELTSTNWFAASRVIASYPYSIKGASFNDFSIAGDGWAERRFFIKFNRGNCAYDRGFMLVSDKKDPCDWGKQFWNDEKGGPALLYSVDKSTPYQQGSVRAADRLLIYLTHQIPYPSRMSSFEFELGKHLLFAIKSNINKECYKEFMTERNDHLPEGDLPPSYRSGYLEYLQQAARETQTSKIVVEMRKSNVIVFRIVFDISKDRNKLTKTNWFTMSRVISSFPYSIKGSSTDYFSIQGSNSSKRRFFVNFVSKKCETDKGFMVVMDRRSICEYGRKGWSDEKGGPALLYSVDKETPYHQGSVRTADRLLVYLTESVDDVCGKVQWSEFDFEYEKLLLFTIRANSNKNALKEFMSERNDPVPEDYEMPTVFRSSLLDNLWHPCLQKDNAKIVFEMRKNNEVVSKVVFDISKDRNKLTKTSWFTASRIISSFPYNIKGSSFNYFSIAGHDSPKRHFFINFEYGGCPNDNGFMVVSDKKDPCDWGKKFWNDEKGGPALLYSVDKSTSYHRGSARSADRLLIYLSRSS